MKLSLATNFLQKCTDMFFMCGPQRESKRIQQGGVPSECQPGKGLDPTRHNCGIVFTAKHTPTPSFLFDS